jgi:exonuclease VII large subunit
MRDRRKLDPLSGRLAALHPARLKDRAAGALDRATARLRWVLGGRSKRSGDALTALAGRLEAAHPRHRLVLAAQKIAAAARQLEAMSYRGVLLRGFSVTRAGGSIVRSAADVRAGQSLLTELLDGIIRSVVEPAGDAAPNGKPAPEVQTALPQTRRAGRSRRPRRTEDQPSLFQP